MKLGAFGLIACLISCASIPPQESTHTDKSMAVHWTSELNMASLLAEEASSTTQKDLADLLTKPWYANIAVTGTRDADVRELNACSTYFANKTQDLRAQKDSEQNALRELEIMCEATQLLSQAVPARRSNIPKNPLNVELPAKLPKLLALVTSQTELERLQQDKTKILWKDINTITRTEAPSKFQRVYYSDAGIQTLAFLGSGDINKDGQQDMLITLTDSVEGGSYYNLRLFVITVNANKQWKIVAQY